MKKLKNLIHQNRFWIRGSNPDQRNAAIRQIEHELQTYSAPSISFRKNPFQLVKIEYPPVEYLYFSNRKRPSTDASSSSGTKK